MQNKVKGGNFYQNRSLGTGVSWRLLCSFCFFITMPEETFDFPFDVSQYLFIGSFQETLRLFNAEPFNCFGERVREFDNGPEFTGSRLLTAYIIFSKAIFYSYIFIIGNHVRRPSLVEFHINWFAPR
jgi:hypothetical protein